MANKDKNYVDNKRLYNEILEYQQKVKKHRKERKNTPLPKIPNYVGESIYKIANKLSYKPCFINYSFKEEMISDGIENCIQYFDNFNPEKSQNPFSYFTQIIWFAFLRRIGKEERNRYIKYKYFQEYFVNTGDISLLLDSDDNHLLSFTMYDNITEFMEKFEKKEKEKKIKRKENKLKADLLKEVEYEEGIEYTDSGTELD
jgi:hypothetical protein